MERMEWAIDEILNHSNHMKNGFRNVQFDLLFSTKKRIGANMLDIAKYDFSWFCKRFCSLIVKFPLDLTPENLNKDDLCSCYDPQEAYDALHSAYTFLTDITNELPRISNTDTDKYLKAKKIFSTFELLWALCFLGELYKKGNQYTLGFNKQMLKSIKKKWTIPDSYGSAFDYITENGCYTEFYKNDRIVENYKSCDSGILYFDHNLTALGLWLFIKKTAQKRWYWESDISGNYATGTFIPIAHCAEPYYRIDMRVFTCGDRLRYDILEQMAGYNETFIGYFKKIFDFIKLNYPECLPERGFYGYLYCATSFTKDVNHRFLGQLGIGVNEHEIGFFTCLSGKEMKPFFEDLDSFDYKVIGKDLFDVNYDCTDLKNPKKVTYKGNKYIFRNYTGIEIRFQITCEDDVKQVIKIMDLKAKCKKNT